MGQATLIKLSDEERQTLHSWVNSHTTQQRHVFRAKIILLADKGKQTKQIAKDLGSNAPTISKWRTRFARDRITGLVDAPRSGQPSKYGKETEKRILAILDQSPPSGFSTWNGRLIARELGDVSKHQVWRVLRKHGIHLQRASS